MDSPDVRQYVDLTVYDDDPVAVLNSILATARGVLPNWTPEAGQIEVALSEAIAVRSSQVAAAINRVPSATTEVLLQLFGLVRSNGTKATALVDIVFDGPGFLPAGTEFLFVDATQRVSYIFVLDDDLAFASAGTATDVAVSAQQVGSAYNLSAQNQFLNILTNIASFGSAVFASSPSGGRDAETDDEYFTRGATLLASYTTALTTASQIKFYTASTKTYANRVEVYNRRRYRDRDTTVSSFGYHDGAVLVAVADKVSTATAAESQLPVSTSNLSDLYDSLVERTPSGLHVDVMSAELAEVHVDVDVVLKSGYNPTSVTSAIQTALKDYLNPNTWDWQLQKVRRNEIIALVDAVDGVDYVDSLTLSGDPVIGVDNIGYYTLAGGSKASGSLTISGATAGSFSAGAAAFYYVDSSGSNADNPKVYTFLNNASITIAGGGGGGGLFSAAFNGVEYNDTNNGGVIPTTALLIGSVGDTGGTATAGAIVGGSADFLQFVPIDNTTYVADDLVLRNLGTLVTFGTLNVAVV